MNKKGMRLGQLLLLMTIILANICARMILSPVLIDVKNDLGASHGQAGRFFLLISISFSVAMFFSGFVSSRLNHHRTIQLSILIIAFSMAGLALSRTLLIFRLCLTGVGIGAGIYGPSGLATIRCLAEEASWGKAFSIHEIGPGIAFIIAPIIAEIGLRFGSWRIGFMIMSGINLVVLLIFICLSEGGTERGEALRLDNLKQVFSLRAFWILALYFMLLTGSSRGVYSMLPTYLVVEHAMEQTLVNLLVSGSRITGLLTLVLSGILVDKFGEKTVIATTTVITGLLTLLLGLLQGPLLIGAVLLQPMLVDAFFPAGLSALAKVGPSRLHSVLVSIVVPIGYSFGAGVVPALMGYSADIGRFPLGFILLGAAVLASLPTLQSLKIPTTK